MNTEKISTLIYIALGALSGFISNAFNVFIVPVAIPAAIFAFSIYFLLKRFNPNKKRKFIIENLVTFILIWLLVWIFLFNVGV